VNRPAGLPRPVTIDPTTAVIRSETEPMNDDGTPRPPAVTGSTPGTPPADRPPTPTAARRADRRRALTTVNVAAATAVVACGTALWVTRPHLLDADAVAQLIGQRISHQVGQPVTVHCPDTVHRRQGETFRCAVTTANGLRRVVVVTVTDDEGNITWRTTH
jgi:hypothetical protein